MGGLVTYVFEDPFQLLAVDLEPDPPTAFLINQRQQWNDYVVHLRPVAQQELLNQLFEVGMELTVAPEQHTSSHLTITPDGANAVSPSPTNDPLRIREIINELDFIDQLNDEQ
jgi:hypothetical protein